MIVRPDETLWLVVPSSWPNATARTPAAWARTTTYGLFPWYSRPLRTAEVVETDATLHAIAATMQQDEQLLLFRAPLPRDRVVVTVSWNDVAADADAVATDVVPSDVTDATGVVVGARLVGVVDGVHVRVTAVAPTADLLETVRPHLPALLDATQPA